MIGLLRIATGPIGALVSSIAATVLLLATLSQCADKHAAERQFKTAEAGRVTAVRDLTQCQTNLAGLNTAVDAQNEAVAAFQVDSARRLSEAQSAVRAAQAAATGARKTAATITTRRGSGDLCRSAENVLRGGEG